MVRIKSILLTLNTLFNLRLALFIKFGCMELRFLLELLSTWDIDGFRVRLFSAYVGDFEIGFETKSVFADDFEAGVGMLLY